MRAKEKAGTVKMIVETVKKRGMPINIQTGSNSDVAEWLGKLLEEKLEVDEPIGTIQDDEYERCPECNGIIGQSAYYCKRCGAYIREKVGK